MVARWWTSLKRLLSCTDRHRPDARKAKWPIYRLEWEILENRLAPTVGTTFAGGLLTVTENNASDTATLTGLIPTGTTIGVAGTMYAGPASFAGVTAITVQGIGGNFNGQSVTLTSAGANAIIMSGNIAINGVELMTLGTSTALQGNSFVENSGAGGFLTLNANVTTVANQLYADIVGLGINASLTGSTVAFTASNNCIDSAAHHSLAIFGNAAFDSDVGSFSALSSLNVSGTTAINLSSAGPAFSGEISTIGTQTYGGAVTLGTSITLLGSTVTFGSTVNGPYGLSVDETFQPVQTFASGTNPASVVLADVNGDGKLDIVTANSGSNTVSVLLGNGDGTFQAAQSFATGTTPVSVAVADLGNGHPDIVTGNSGSNTVSVLLGNGNGTFQAAQNFATGSGPDSVVVADVNGDGKLDLVAANSGSNSVSVLLGNSNGTFQAAQNFTTGTNPKSVAVADLIGDGKLDIITANYGSNTVSVLLGNGNGTFQAAQNFAAGSQPASVAVGDFRGDGKLDLVVADDKFPSNTVSLLLGNGDGTFQAAQNIVSGASTPNSVTVADINGDGKLDLVVTNGLFSVTTLLGNGDGTFQTAENLNYGAASVAVGDVNGDGRLDIVGVQMGVPSVSVLLSENSGNAVFDGIVGGATPLTSLTVDATATINTTAITTSGTQTYNGNFTLNTNATLTATTVTIASPHAINLFSGTFTLNVLGNLNLSGTTSFNTTLAGTGQFGRVQLLNPSSTVVTLAPGATLNVTLAYTPQPGDSFDLITHENGVFSNHPNNSIITLNGFNFLVTYDDLMLVYQPHQQSQPGPAPGATTISLVISPDPAIVGQPVTFLVTVTSSGNALTPAGTVSFYDDGTLLGSAAVGSNGVASFTTVFAAIETESVTASFLGAGGFLNSLTPNAFTLSVSPPVETSHIVVAAAGPGGGPIVNVYDATTGKLITTIVAFAPTFTGGVRVAVADVNGDGTPDIICGAGPGGGPEVAVFDGKTFQRIMDFQALPAQFTGGVWVAAGDVNRDGYADIIVAADAGGGPEVTITSGKDGSLLASFYATAPTFTGGIRVACADLNGDGFADVIAAAGPGGGPQVTIFDGKSLSLLTAFYALPPTFTGGMYVAAGDVNGDGHADIIVGAEKGGGPEVNVFNGAGVASGGMPPSLYAYYALPSQFTGGVRVGYSSDFEGHAAVLSVAGPGGGPQLSIFDGVTQVELDSFYAFAPTFGGGVYVGGN